MNLWIIKNQVFTWTSITSELSINSYYFITKQHLKHSEMFKIYKLTTYCHFIL